MTREAAGAIRREVATRMAETAAAWLGGLDGAQRRVAVGAVPDDHPRATRSAGGGPTRPPTTAG